MITDEKDKKGNILPPVISIVATQDIRKVVFKTPRVSFYFLFLLGRGIAGVLWG